VADVAHLIPVVRLEDHQRQDVVVRLVACGQNLERIL
jgi:hypothetical protein